MRGQNARHTGRVMKKQETFNETSNARRCDGPEMKFEYMEKLPRIPSNNKEMDCESFLWSHFYSTGGVP